MKIGIDASAMLVARKNGYEVYTTQLISAITRLFDNSPLRAEIGKAGRAYVEFEWNWESLIANLEKQIYDVARKSRN